MTLRLLTFRISCISSFYFSINILQINISIITKIDSNVTVILSIILIDRTTDI